MTRAASEKAPSPPADHDAHYSVIAGAVFRENGFSLPGVTVTIAVADTPKMKKLQSTSDARGEFAFRVPPQRASHVVKAASKGFQPAEKHTSIKGEERVEVTLTLISESK